MVKLGITGFGFMGRTHLQAFQGLPDARVIAVCDSRLAESDISGLKDGAVGNIDTGLSPCDLAGIEVFSDLGEMLGSCKLDAAVIALPTHLHRVATVTALEAGVHVLCEKPMSLTLDDCDAMIAAAKKAKRYLQVGQCIRFWPQYEALRTIVRSQSYGRIKTAHFFRRSPRPAWAPDSWFNNRKLSGGALFDLHVHDTDYVLHLLGMPRSVTSAGTIDDVDTIYNYGDDTAISAEGAWTETQAHGFKMGFRVALEKATLEFDSSAAEDLVIYPAGEEMRKHPCGKESGYVRQAHYFLQHVSGEPSPTIISPGDARKSIATVLAEQKSLESGKPVNIEDYTEEAQ